MFIISQQIIPISMEKSWHRDAFFSITPPSSQEEASSKTTVAKTNELRYSCLYCGISTENLSTFRKKSRKCN